MKSVLTLALLAAVMLGTVGPALAQRGGSKYDWQSGNSYNWQNNPDGSTDVRGWNLNTGSTWGTRIEPNGDMRGTDSRGNLWQYNENTGTYLNTDGTMCVGKGASRICN
jgi:hypothetical protein